MSGEDCSAPTKQFHMSTHCQPPAARDLKGTLGTPIGIIRVACRRGPLEELQTGRFHVSAFASPTAASRDPTFCWPLLCRPSLENLLAVWLRESSLC